MAPPNSLLVPLSPAPEKTPFLLSWFRGNYVARLQYSRSRLQNNWAKLTRPFFPHTEIESLAGNLCGDVNSANSAELASASNYITSALGTAATASGTSSGSSPTSASGNAAARTDSPLVGMGAMGAAAALAVLAL